MTIPQLCSTATRVLEQDLSVIPRLDSLIAQTFKRFKQADDKASFLEEVFDFTFPDDSPLCKEYGLTRAVLLHRELPHGLLPSGITNGLAYELHKFQTQRGLNTRVYIDWLQTLCPGIQLEVKKLDKNMKRTFLPKMRKLISNKTKNPANFDNFAKEFFVQPANGTCTKFFCVFILAIYCSKFVCVLY